MYSYYSILAKVPGVACGNFERIFFLFLKKKKMSIFLAYVNPQAHMGTIKKMLPIRSSRLASLS